MKYEYEVITKTLITKIYFVDAENEKEAVDVLDSSIEPAVVDEDYEEVVSVTKLK